MTRSQKIAADVAALLRARNPLIWIVTREEARVERYLFEAAASAAYVAMTWDAGQGVADMRGNPLTSMGGPDLGETLSTIRALTSGGPADRRAWIMRDVPAWLEGPIGITTLRQMRNLARVLPGIPRERAQAIICITPSGKVPDELAGHATVIEWPLPDRDEVAAILDASIDVLPENMKATAAPNGCREAAIDAAVGLSGEEAASCYARSLVQLRTIDPPTVAKEKRRVIARERVLEWYDPIPGGLNAVGGLENLKTWLTARRAAYSPQARAYGLPAPKGALLVGVPGCLAEGTRVAYKRGKRPCADRSLPIETMYRKFNGIFPVHGFGVSGAGAAWMPGIPTYAQSWDAETGCIVFNEITAITDSGIKECIRICTDKAGVVELTADHPVLCADGLFRNACELHPGDQIVSRGSMKPSPTGQSRVCRKRTIVEGLKFHPTAWRKVVVDGDKRYEYGRITKARLVVEAAMNKIDFDEFVRILKEDPERAERFAYLPADYDVHHADENPQNDDIANLVVVPHDEHPLLHDPLSNLNVEHTITATLTTVSPIGPRHCYDVTMAEPRSNIAINDGIVVHNCGKSLTAKAVATAWGVPLLRMDLGALKGKFVGESEGNLRKALRVIEAIGRCVVWLDEIEKALAGATQGAADGGVSMDALGTILSWMQERAGQAFVMATANDVSGLPPELLRKGRFDEIWWVDLPNWPERMAIIKAALREHARGSLDINADKVADVTKDFTGSEIAALVPDALYAAFAEDMREPTTSDLIAAALTVTPLSKTAAEKIARLREWAVGRARPATKREDEQQEQSARVLDL